MQVRTGHLTDVFILNTALLQWKLEEILNDNKLKVIFTTELSEQQTGTTACIIMQEVAHLYDNLKKMDQVEGGEALLHWR